MRVRTEICFKDVFERVKRSASDTRDSALLYIPSSVKAPAQLFSSSASYPLPFPLLKVPVDPPKMEPLDEDERESAGRVEDEVSTSGCDMMKACSVRETA